jgi:hypothetical protein
METNSTSVNHVRATKSLQSPKCSPLAKSFAMPSALLSSPSPKRKLKVSSSSPSEMSLLVNTTHYDKLSSLLNLSEDELNRRYEEWMRIAADNVSLLLFSHALYV